MKNARRMRSCQAVRNTDDQLDDLSPCPHRSGSPLFQRAAIDELGHEILPPVELADVVHRENVGMIQRRCHLRFALETPAACGICQIIGKKFDSDMPV